MEQTLHTTIYTTTGPQRPVFLAEGTTAHFVLTLLEGDAGLLQTSCDPPDNIRRGLAAWEPFSGGLEGAVGQITALRAVLTRNTGWARLEMNVKGNVKGAAHGE